MADLPRDLRARILSFLYSKTAVRISLTTKPFKSLWKQSKIVNLRLDSQRYLKKFLQERGDCPVDKLTIGIDALIPQESLDECFIYAVQHKVKTFSLGMGLAFMNLDAAINLPLQIFQSSSIRELYLESSWLPFSHPSTNAIQFPEFLPPDFPWLPNLKVLGLEDFEISSVCFSIFQNIDVLILTDCNIVDKQALYLEFPKLQRLEIHSWISVLNPIEVHCPNLRYLFIRGEVMVKFSHPPQREAFLDLDVSDGSKRKETVEIFYNLLKAVQEVEILSLSTRTLKLFEIVSLELQPFTKLQLLILVTRKRRDEVLSINHIKELQKLGAGVLFDEATMIPASTLAMLLEASPVDEIHLGVPKHGYVSQLDQLLNKGKELRIA